MIDAITNARLVGLHPEMVKRFVNLNGQFSSWAPAGTFLRITVGLRTWAQQAEAFTQGRTLLTGPIITNASPGFSWHQYGFAVDVVPIVGQVPDWNIETANWQKVFGIIPNVGLFSGSNFKTIAGDDDHIQLAEIPESPTAADAALLQTSGIAAVWVKYFPPGQIITDPELGT